MSPLRAKGERWVVGISIAVIILSGLVAYIRGFNYVPPVPPVDPAALSAALDNLREANSMLSDHVEHLPADEVIADTKADLDGYIEAAHEGLQGVIYGLDGDGLSHLQCTSRFDSWQSDELNPMIEKADAAQGFFLATGPSLKVSIDAVTGAQTTLARLSPRDPELIISARLITEAYPVMEKLSDPVTAQIIRAKHAELLSYVYRTVEARAQYCHR